MSKDVYFLNMFTEYEPSDELREAFSQAVISAADIDPGTRTVSTAIYSETYIPTKYIKQIRGDIEEAYDLSKLLIHEQNK